MLQIKTIKLIFKVVDKAVAANVMTMVVIWNAEKISIKTEMWFLLLSEMHYIKCMFL